MLALFFDVLPKPGHEDAYFEIAAGLRPELDRNAGLVFIDRYRSLDRPGWILSHQYWRDEASMVAWRTHGRHHMAQLAGRTTHFADYRLRVARVVLDAGPGKPSTRQTEQAAYADPALTPPRYVVAVASRGAAYGGAGLERFASVYRPGECVAVGAVADRDAGEALVRGACAARHVTAARLCLVARDYGRDERTEAPQVMPDVPQRS